MTIDRFSEQRPFQSAELTTDPSQHQRVANETNEPIRRTNDFDFRVDPDSDSLGPNRIEGSFLVALVAAL